MTGVVVWGSKKRGAGGAKSKKLIFTKEGLIIQNL